jgi:thioredoxin 2
MLPRGPVFAPRRKLGNIKHVMNTASLDDNGVVIACGNCGQRNRIHYGQLDRAIRCGHCKQPIAGVDVPVEVDNEEHFEALIHGSVLPVLVDFWAPWCGPCKAVAPEFEKVAYTSLGKLIVAKVNTEQLPDLAQRFSIHAIPTLMLFHGGNSVARESGARPAKAIEAFVEHALSEAGVAGHA